MSDDGGNLRRGRLLHVYIPYVAQQPMELVAEGRTDPTEHSRVDYRVVPFDIKVKAQAPKLPVAAMPLGEKERTLVFKTKRRPALVLNCGGAEVDKSLRIGAAKWQTTLTIAVAPYFGTEQNGERGGWREEFVTRIRRAEYPQYMWDMLPISHGAVSILRLDQQMPIGKDPHAYEFTKYYLSNDALQIVDEWRRWLDTSQLPVDTTLHLFRSEMQEKEG